MTGSVAGCFCSIPMYHATLHKGCHVRLSGVWEEGRSCCLGQSPQTKSHWPGHICKKLNYQLVVIKIRRLRALQHRTVVRICRATACRNTAIVAR
jgi:hypothetical protein